MLCSEALKFIVFPGANSRSIKQLVPEADGAGGGTVLKSNRLGAWLADKGSLWGGPASLLLPGQGLWALSQPEGRERSPALWEKGLLSRGGGEVLPEADPGTLDRGGGQSWDELWKDKKDLPGIGIIVISADAFLNLLSVPR